MLIDCEIMDEPSNKSIFSFSLNKHCYISTVCPINASKCCCAR